MFHPNQIRTGEAFELVIPSESHGCLVAGCPCKDARIVSHRRAAFFAAVARESGETADRVVPVDPVWRIPAFQGA